MGLLVPERRRGQEILDNPAVDAATRLRSITDVTRSNQLFGGKRAAVEEIAIVIGGVTGEISLLDVGTGLADIPAAIRNLSRPAGAPITTIGLDEASDLLSAARGSLTHAVCGRATALPFRDSSVDIVLCSQLLHHFADADLAPVIVELDRVARRRVVIADLRRSWIAAAGFWLASFPLRFSPVTRHDAVVSIFRGFTAVELHRAVVQAVGTAPSIHRRLGFRLTISWQPRRPE